MKGAATWIGFALAAASAVWGGEASASAGKNPPKVGGEVEIANVPFDINEVIRTVRKNRGLPEEPSKRGFHAEARGERPFVSKGNAFSHETPRFQVEVGEDGLRYFAQGSRWQPDFEILSVSFEWGGVPRRGRGKSQTAFGKDRLEEHVPGLLKGKVQDGITPYVRNRGEEGVEMYWVVESVPFETASYGGLLRDTENESRVPEEFREQRNVTKGAAQTLQIVFNVRAAGEPEMHPEGLVFPAWREEGQVTLSNVTVVDAAGRRERVRPSHASGREILFEVSREFLEAARYPILIDPTVGPEFPVEPSPVYGPVAFNQYSPSVASNGTDYFVVWDDYRNATTASDIYGARVAPDGTVLDPTGIAVSTAADSQENPSAASNGTDYFVAWDNGNNIYGTRVASDGTVLDPAGIAVSTAADDQQYPSVTSNGTDYFIAWMDLRSGSELDIYGARVASDGTVLDPAGIAVSTAVDDQEYPSAASNGTDYFVAWDDWRNGSNRDVYGARVTSAGTVLDPSGIAVARAAFWQLSPSVASNGTDYFVAWRDYRSGADWDIYGTRVTSAGAVLDDPFVGIAVSTAANVQRYPSVASNGTGYFVAWEDLRSGGADWDIYGARVSSAGTVLDPAGIAVSTAGSWQFEPSVASNGTDYFVAWQDLRNGAEYDVYGTRVTSAGTVLDFLGIAVSTAASSQYNPSVASNGTDYFVVWQDRRNLSFAITDIYGTRVASDGTVLDPAGIAVSTAFNYQLNPSAASNGTDYFVAWDDWRNVATTSIDIYGARVASDGTVLDATGIAISTVVDDQEWPSVSSNGTDYFVTWGDYRSGTDDDIYGSRVAPDGTVLDAAGIAVSTEASNQLYPSVASNGTDYFVAWEDWRNDGGCFCNIDIYGARVRASDGALLDGPPDTGGIAVSTEVDDQYFPSAASNGTDYFIAWMDLRSGSELDIYGARVASDGTVLDISGIAVSTAADDQEYPSAASNGTDYFVAWEDYRSGTDEDIYGARVTSAGTVLDAAGILIQQSPYRDFRPAVAYSACGKYLVAYDRFYDDPNFQSQRVMARTIQGSAPEPPDISQDISFNPLPTLTELCGDGDVVVEPGEEWQVTVQLINAACDANNVKADLTVNPGSAVAAGVCNNPGLYGTMPGGATAQFTYSFVVDSLAVCVNDVTFDVTGIVSDEGAYPDEIAAFGVTVGQVIETAAQATDPLATKNGTASSLFAPAFTLPLPVSSAELSYTLTHDGGAADLLDCTKVELLDPLASPTLIKDFGKADPLKPVDVTGSYIGIGTYELQLTEAGKGCGNGSATISSGTLSVSDTGCDVSACACPPSADPVAVPDGGAVPGTPLMVADAGGGAVTLTWDVACNATDYAVMAGDLSTLSSGYNHAPSVCTDAGGDLTETVAPAGATLYFLVAPHNGVSEGSYGTDSAAVERPPAAGACYTRRASEAVSKQGAASGRQGPVARD